MAKNEDLVKDLDDLSFETNVDSNDLDELEDISEEELQEIEQLVEKPKKGNKAKQKIKKKKIKKLKNKVIKKEKPIIEDIIKDKPIKKKIKKKTSKTKTKKKGKSVFYIVLGLIIVALIIAAGFMTDWFKSVEVQDNEVAAYVNGEPVFIYNLNQKYDQLTQASLSPIAKEDVLDSLIEQELIKQKAEELGITVSLEEAEASLNELLIMRGLTKTQLKENLEASGMNLDDLLEEFQYYILLDKLANETFAKDIEISNEELVNYLSSKAYVRHILLLSEQEDEEIYNKLVELKTELEQDDSTFCDYVESMSEDPGSVETCGEYFFGKGEMVPEFEDAAFSLNAGEMAIVKTAYGYHLIQKLAMNEEKIEEIKDEIKANKASEKYILFLEELKENADIEILLDNAEDAEETLEDETPFEIIEEETEDVETGEVETEQEISEEELEEVGEAEVVEEETIVEEIIEPEVITEPIEEIIEEEEPTEEVIITEEPELILYEIPKLKYFYSESDEKKAEITQLIRDLETQGYVNVDWKCVRVNAGDKELCIELYGEYHYETSMQEARELGLKYAPTLFIDEVEYAGDYTLTDVEIAICDLAGC